MIAGWRGVPGPYTAGGTGNGTGGGLDTSVLNPGFVVAGGTGNGSGGGHVPGSAEPLTGYGGCGGPGPGAYIGIVGGTPDG